MTLVLGSMGTSHRQIPRSAYEFLRGLVVTRRLAKWFDSKPECHRVQLLDFSYFSCLLTLFLTYKVFTMHCDNLEAF